MKTYTDQHPITPPPELVEELQDIGNLDAITLAYRAGADQELEACLWHLESTRCNQIVITTLRAARRPKPPSLKEQALAQLDVIQLDLDSSNIYGANTDTIRRALEALPDE